MNNPTTPDVKEAISFLQDFKPKVYLLHLIIGKHQEHITLAFNTRLDRINFEQQFCDKYEGIIHLMSRSEPLLNPRVLETIDNLNDRTV